MRVLQVYKDYAPVVGGVESHIQLLAEGLREQGVEVQVLVTNTGRRTVRGEINGVPIIKAGRLFNISSAPMSLSFHSELARLGRAADIVHLHSPYPPAEMSELVLRRGKRFLLTYHSDIVRQRVLGTLYAPVLRRVLSRADRIIVSNPRYIQLSKFLQPHAAKCVVIHFGIDLRRFALTPPVQQRAATLRAEHAGKPVILSVGKLRHYKGIDVLIDALTSLDAQALIVGSGPMQALWKQKASEAGVADRAVFLGEVTEEELVALYYAADIFAFPSTNRAETWGLAQIEAMACGLPVVCTEVGTGTSYVTQHTITGLVIPPANATALAEALQALIDRPEWAKQLGSAGRERAHREFSRETMIERTLSLYTDVLGEDGVI